MAMTMKSVNPMANKARINAQLGMMTGLWMAFAKLPNKMSKSKKDEWKSKTVCFVYQHSTTLMTPVLSILVDGVDCDRQNYRGFVTWSTSIEVESI